MTGAPLIPSEKAIRSSHAVQLEEVKQRSSTRQVHLRAVRLLIDDRRLFY